MNNILMIRKCFREATDKQLFDFSIRLGYKVDSRCLSVDDTTWLSECVFYKLQFNFDVCFATALLHSPDQLF